MLRRAARHFDPGEDLLAAAAAQQRIDRHAEDFPDEIMERQVDPRGRETGRAPGGLPTHQIDQHPPVQGVFADQLGRHMAVEHRPDDLDRLGLVARRLTDADDPCVGVNLDDDIRQDHEAVGVARPHDLSNSPLVVARGRVVPCDLIHAVPESPYRDTDGDSLDGGDFHAVLRVPSLSSISRDVLVTDSPPRAVQRSSRGRALPTRSIVSITSSSGMTGS